MEKAAKNSTAGRAAAGKTCVLVLGMHRSGTSALARVLNLLGCDLPKTLMEAHSSNETGHWESVEIKNLNDEILKSAGSNWLDWLEFNPGWYASPKAEEFKERALATLEAEYGQSRLFVLKDPRICRFVPFWLDVLDTAGVKPVIVRQVRNPLEVAESLSRRNGIDPALGHLLWLDHVLEAEAGSRGRQRFQSSYDRLLKEWPSLISEMQDALQLSWPRMSTLTNDEIDRFLTEKLRHHEQSTEAVTRNPFLSAWLRDTFSIFSRWAREGENSGDYAELDRMRSELYAAAPAFARLILSGHQRASELKSARNQIEEQKKKVEELEADRRVLVEKELNLDCELKAVSINLESTERELKANQADLAQRISELKCVQADLTRTQDALAQRTTDVDEANAQLREITSGIETLKAELSQAQGTLTKRTAEVDAANAQLHSATSAAEVLRAELSQTQSALAQRSAEAHDVTTQLQEAIASLAEMEGKCRREAERNQDLEKELETERLRANSELARLQKERQDVERRLSDRFSEIAALTRLLGKAESGLAVKTNKLEARESELTAKKRQFKERDKAVRNLEGKIALLREVSAVLLNGNGSKSLAGMLTSLISTPHRLKKQRALLKEHGFFDPDAYLTANPDVAEAGRDPLWHYVNFGLLENRPLYPNKRSTNSEGSNEKPE